MPPEERLRGRPAQVPGRVKVNGLYFAGNAIDIDCLPDGVNVAPIDFTFNTTIFESAVSPYVRFNCPGGIFNGIVMDDVVQADSIVGFGTPSIDAQNDSLIGSVLWKGGAVNAAQQPAFVTSSSVSNLLLMNAPFTNPGNAANTTSPAPASSARMSLRRAAQAASKRTCRR